MINKYEIESSPSKIPFKSPKYAFLLEQINFYESQLNIYITKCADLEIQNSHFKSIIPTQKPGDTPQSLPDVVSNPGPALYQKYHQALKTIELLKHQNQELLFTIPKSTPPPPSPTPLLWLPGISYYNPSRRPTFHHGRK
jgi:hypothetical protein